MKTDVQIAQEATMLPISEVAAKLGIDEENLYIMESIRQRYL